MSYVDRARYRGFDGVAIVCCLDYNNPKVAELLRSSIKVVTIDYLANNRTGDPLREHRRDALPDGLSLFYGTYEDRIYLRRQQQRYETKAGRLLQEHGGAWDYRSG